MGRRARFGVAGGLGLRPARHHDTADGGSGAGKGVVIGGLVGAGGGALYGITENRKADAACWLHASMAPCDGTDGCAGATTGCGATAGAEATILRGFAAVGLLCALTSGCAWRHRPTPEDRVPAVRPHRPGARRAREMTGPDLTRVAR